MDYSTKQRIRLTADEIDAVLAVAGDALYTETFANYEDPKETERMIVTFERARDKLEELSWRLRNRSK